MIKMLLAAALASATMLSAPAAQAAQFISFDGISGTFGNNNVAGGSFDNTFTFDVGSLAGTAGGTISSIRVSSLTNIDFTSVTLNDEAFDVDLTGTVEFRHITLPVGPGLQTIRVKGTSGGNASYDGVIAFAAVPEPATWATMLIGFGAVGTAMRRGRRNRGPAAVAA
jgi:hypothetical protein